MRTAMFLSLALLTTSLAACAEPRTPVSEARNHGEGTAQTYAVTPDVARALAIEVLRENGAESIEEHSDLVVGNWGIQLANWGSSMEVRLEPSGPNTSVVAVGRRKLAVQLMTNLTETTFHADLGKKVARRHDTPAK